MHDPSATRTDIPGLLILELGLQYNEAGWFKENWHQEKMLALGLPDFGPVQHNVTHVESRGTMRGFLAEPWDRLVSLTSGRALGAWIDLREGPSFGKVVTQELTPSVAAFVPHGVASAHQVLEDGTTFSRLMSHHWTPQARNRFSTVDPFDPALRIAWPFRRDQVLTAPGQRRLPLLRDAIPVTPRGVLVVGTETSLGRSLARQWPDAVGVTREDLDDGIDWSHHHTIVNTLTGTADPEGGGWRDDAELARRLTDVARRHHQHYVHLTVDPSFDHVSPSHDEDAQLSMATPRDHALAVGEVVAATAPRYLVIRTTWVVGDEDQRITAWQAAARAGQLVRAASDQHGRLTFVSQLADGIRHLLESAASGTYNLTGEGPVVAWADVARRVFELSGRPASDVRESTGAAGGPGAVLDVGRAHAEGVRPGNAWLMLDDHLREDSSPRDGQSHVAAQLAGPFRVLFVCTANICRSAYADVVARGRQLPGLEFGSAGTHALVGRPIDPPIGAHVNAPGGADEHRARQLTRALMEDADLVLTMGQEHRRWILDEWPSLGRKTFVIGHAARELASLPQDVRLDELASYLWRHRTLDPGDDVPDPYNRGPEAAASSTRLIDEHLEVILEVLASLVQ